MIFILLVPLARGDNIKYVTLAPPALPPKIVTLKENFTTFYSSPNKPSE